MDLHQHHLLQHGVVRSPACEAQRTLQGDITRSVAAAAGKGKLFNCNPARLFLSGVYDHWPHVLPRPCLRQACTTGVQKFSSSGFIQVHDTVWQRLHGGGCCLVSKVGNDA